MEQLGIASNDTALTAFVHAGVERNSRKRFDEAAELEVALIAQMREAAPDMGKGDTWPLHLRVAAQTLRDVGGDRSAAGKAKAHSRQYRPRRAR